MAKECFTSESVQDVSPKQVDEHKSTECFDHLEDLQLHQEGVSNSVRKALFLEVFAGTCRLSAACKQVGLRALPVDKDVHRSENLIDANFDVTNPHQLKSLRDLITAEKEFIVHAHFAPSCGTASKARNKKIPGINPKDAPKPLRSETHPDGLLELGPKDADRVAKANDSYKAAMELIDMLIQLGISVSLENPTNSLFWLTSFVLALESILVTIPHSTTACMVATETSCQNSGHIILVNQKSTSCSP